MQNSVNPIRFADLTTLRIGGVIASFTQVHSEDDLLSAVSESSVQIIGGGSNLLVSDEAFERPVVQIATRGIQVRALNDLFSVTTAAGENWDRLVAFCTAQGFSGLTALSGIPGTVGATVIQNVGAYGTDVSATISQIRVLDRSTSRVSVLSNADCEFGYRTSRFKGKDAVVVLDVTFLLQKRSTEIIQYQQLAELLDVKIGDAVDLEIVRKAVLYLRSSKAMVIDDHESDSASVGSFFVNPVVAAELATPIALLGCPGYQMENNKIKLSAAWLIENAGIPRGFSLNNRVRVSAKHSLAIANIAGGSCLDVLELARFIRDRVLAIYQINLTAEPVLLNCKL